MDPLETFVVRIFKVREVRDAGTTLESIIKMQQAGWRFFSSIQSEHSNS